MHAMQATNSPSYVDDVIYTPSDPVVTIGVSSSPCAQSLESMSPSCDCCQALTVASGVITVKLGEVGELKAIVVAVHCPHLQHNGVTNS